MTRLEELGFKTLRVERIDWVVKITIDRPSNSLNGVDDSLHHDLGLLFRSLKRETARVVVLTGREDVFLPGVISTGFPPSIR